MATKAKPRGDELYVSLMSFLGAEGHWVAADAEGLTPGVGQPRKPK
jgi:hypothetical protein